MRDLRRSWVEQIMGMPVSVLARGAEVNDERVPAAVSAVFAELREVDAMFSTYREDSVVSRMRRGEVSVDDCPPPVREVAAGCEHARALTGGYFDARCPDVAWGPSGYVKGWATERAARHLAMIGGLEWCLNAGGDVLTRCEPGGTFAVGIADPGDATRLAATVRRGTGAAATSGTAQRGAHLYNPLTDR